MSGDGDADQRHDVRRRVGERVKAVRHDRDGACVVSEDDLRQRDGEIQEQNAIEDRVDFGVSVRHTTPRGSLSEDPRVGNRPPVKLHAADDVFLWHHSPMPAVRAVVAMVAHHEVVPVVDPLGAEVVVAAILRWYEVVRQWHIVHVDADCRGDTVSIGAAKRDARDAARLGVDAQARHQCHQILEIVRLSPLELFRGQVRDRAAERIRADTSSSRRQPRDPKVNQLGVTLLVEQDVVRLDVAVNDTLAVQQLQRIGQFTQAGRAYSSAGTQAERAAGSATDTASSHDLQHLAVRSYSRANHCFAEVGEFEWSEAEYLNERNARVTWAKMEGKHPWGQLAWKITSN